MANDERILKKIGKLLSQYGVSDEEKSNFIIDLQNLKDDEEEPMPTENDEKVEEPVEEEMPPKEEGEPTEEPTEPETVEEPVAPSDEEPKPDANEVEENTDVPVPQEPEQPADESVDYQAKYEELQKAVDGMSKRFDSLEEALKEVGVLNAPENPVGVPNQEPATGGNFETSNEDVLRLLNK